MVKKYSFVDIALALGLVALLAYGQYVIVLGIVALFATFWFLGFMGKCKDGRFKLIAAILTYLIIALLSAI